MAIALFLLGIMLSGTVGSELEPSSGATLLDILREVIKEVSDIKESVAILAENDQTLSQALDKTAEALKSEFRNLSLRVEQNQMDQTLRIDNLSQQVEEVQRDQTLRIDKLSQQVEEVQSFLTCTGEPPSPQNGRTIHFERKHGSVVLYRCDVDLVEAENSTVRCHLGKWEGLPPLCTRPAPSLRVHVDKDFLFGVANVSCWAEESGQPVHFTRILDTGEGGALPTDARTFTRDGVAVLDLSGVPAHDKRGVFQCGHVNRKGRTFLIGRIGEFSRPIVKSVGDNVTLGLYFGPDDPSFRWLHDGQRVPAWDGRMMVEIAGVGKEDAGVYEQVREGGRRVTQYFSRLVVRGCPAGFFGQRCQGNCPSCRNGGLCDEKLGTCVCSVGFRGLQCEEACGRGRIGPDCSDACGGGDCRWQFFCLPDPYGCSCAAGYHGSYCGLTCKEGKFGADCKQTCHCQDMSCDPYTGACSGGCSEGWTGASCQIPVGN